MSSTQKLEQKTLRLRLIAGPNGSGKSSYFHQLKNEVDTGLWINADELNADLTNKGYIEFEKLGFFPTKKQWDSFVKLKSSLSFITQFDLSDTVSLVTIGQFILSVGEKKDNNMLAAFVADFFRYVFVKKSLKFTTETVFSHPSKIKLIKDARAKGYKTYLYFICTESPELNIERVKSRTMKGGHPVPPQKIIERYYKSIQVMISSLPFFDRVFIYDNSQFEHRLVASIAHGKLEAIYSSYIPNWVKKVLNSL